MWDTFVLPGRLLQNSSIISSSLSSKCLLFLALQMLIDVLKHGKHLLPNLQFNEDIYWNFVNCAISIIVINKWVIALCLERYEIISAIAGSTISFFNKRKDFIIFVLLSYCYRQFTRITSLIDLEILVMGARNVISDDNKASEVYKSGHHSVVLSVPVQCFTWTQCY